MVTFGGTADQFDLEVFDALLGTENAADEALKGAGAGWIDGNQIGDHQYDVYFANAPADWTRIELRDGLNDVDATVFTS